jgi:hypothetical protein
LHAAVDSPLTFPYFPAGQAAVHNADDWAVEDPYRPALQFVHEPDPLMLNLPTGHTNAVGDVDPEGQENPALQLPLQLALAMADTAPYRPAGHGLHTPEAARL